MTNLCAEGKLLASVIRQTAAAPRVMLGRFGSGEVNRKNPSADVPFIWSFDERACGEAAEENGLLFLNLRRSWREGADVFALTNRRYRLPPIALTPIMPRTHRVFANAMLGIFSGGGKPVNTVSPAQPDL